jgi:outer membrane cobalamin receptor
MKNLIKYLVLFSFIIFSLQNSFAAKGKISGYVFDKTTHHPIPDANIILSNTSLGAASKDGGFYFIENVPPGKYDIVVKVIGYETAVKKEVTINENLVINFFLNPTAVPLDPIIVTATLSDHLQSQVTVASEVITLPRLRERGGSTMAEAMESVGSVYFKSYDGIAGTQLASIRGSNVDQVVVMLDGLRLNTAQGGGVDLNLIPVSAVEKIEVIRGGHSALVGSDAIGGTIQLVSNESIDLKGFSYGMNTTVGSFGTKTLDLFGSQKIGLLSAFVNFSRIQGNGNFTYKAPGTAIKATRENNDYQGNNLFLKTIVDLSPNHKFHIIYHNLQTEKGNAGSVNLNPFDNQPMLTPLARAKVDRKLLSLKSENQLTDRFRLEGQTFYQAYNYHYEDPAGWTSTDDKHENSAFGFNLQGQLQFNKSIGLTSGAEFRQDRLKSTKFKVDDRNIQSFYGQAEIRLPISLIGLPMHWTTIPAIRWDNYSDVGSQFSPKLGMLVTTGEATSLGFRGNLGNSYRVPTFDDLYWPDEIWVKGNPALKPETSTSYDLGIFLNQKSSYYMQIEANYFNSSIGDLITWAADSLNIWQPMNIGKANINGIETGLKFGLPANIVHLDIFYTWMKATNQTQNSADRGKRLIYRPDNKLDILIGSKFAFFSANINYSVVSKRYIAGDNSQSLSDYQLLNGNIGFNFPFSGFTFDTRLQILNMLDKSIYIYDGYPLPGREFRVSLGISY